MDVLTDKQRLALQLYRREGLTQGRIAERLGITRESVNRLIARAERRLTEIRAACAASGRGDLLKCVLL